MHISNRSIDPERTSDVSSVVWLVFILETATTIVIGILGWSMFGKGFGNPLSLLDVDPTMAALPFINGIGPYFVYCSIYHF